MTYDELLQEQKEKFFKLNKKLDVFRHGFSGPDPYWDIPYPIRGKRNRWGRCYACRYKSHTGFGFANRLRAGVDTANGKFDFDFKDIWFDRKTAFAAVDDVLAWSGYFWRKENAQVEDMTANKFFEYCRIAYLASEEKDDHLDRSLSGREMYDRYSDGRYGALLDIDPDSTEEFMKWLDGKVPCDRHGGDHPCLPIWLDDAESVRNRILALDNIGIIPDSDSLHRGWQEYPSDFKIADVMHFASFGQMRRFALPFVSWKPLPVLVPTTCARRRI